MPQVKTNLIGMYTNLMKFGVKQEYTFAKCFLNKA